MSADVKLEDVWIRFGEFVAARDVNIHIQAGEFFTILGPSGCGKTTLLRAVSGFLDPSEGKVLIGGEDMAGIGPNKRPTALIFQNLALFPLMTVWENIVFSLEVRGVMGMVARVTLAAKCSSMPHDRPAAGFVATAGPQSSNSTSRAVMLSLPPLSFAKAMALRTPSSMAGDMRARRSASDLR